LTGNCKRHQDMVTISIKQSRAAALIPYTVSRKVIAGASYEER
ncbi:MAG: 30S ribosomal protein S18, partial [Sulfuricurvum sp.]|nr:30S ribosomal protein S18 [Sulfuricurvum sp.]